MQYKNCPCRPCTHAVRACCSCLLTLSNPCPIFPQEVTLVRQLAESRQRLQDLREQRNEEVRAFFKVALPSGVFVPKLLAANGSSM